MIFLEGMPRQEKLYNDDLNALNDPRTLEIATSFYLSIAVPALTSSTAGEIASIKQYLNAPIIVAEDAVENGWKVGQPITNLTAKGSTPTWSTVRQRFWKNEAFYNENAYNESNLLRMRRGLAPQRINPKTGLMESMELHHTVPQRNGGLFEFIKVWPEEHKAIDRFRR